MMNFRSSIIGLFPIVALLFNGTISAALAASENNILEFSLLYKTEFLFPSLEENLRPDSVEISSLIEDLPREFQEALPTNLPSVLTNPEILDVTVSGQTINENPIFGLTNFVSNTFGLPLPPQIDPQTGAPTKQVSIFRANPADLNIDLPIPQFSDVYFGSTTDNKLFGLANDQAIFNFVEGTVTGGGTITIVGGEGIFKNATGRIEFTQRDRLSPPGEPVIGEARLDFFLEIPQSPPNPEIPQSVPEPRTQVMLIALLGMAVVRYLSKQSEQ